MLFINTRPIDEELQNERRPSKAPSHLSAQLSSENSPHMARLSLSLLLFYLLVSVFPCVLFYPVSLHSLLVPVMALFFALCSLRSDFTSTQWPFLFIAVMGILIKIGAIIVYISLFPMRDNHRRQGFPPRNGKNDAELDHYRKVFFIVLVAVEIFIFIIGACLKCQLIAFQKREHRQKRRPTLTSNRLLIA